LIMSKLYNSNGFFSPTSITDNTFYLRFVIILVKVSYLQYVSILSIDKNVVDEPFESEDIIDNLVVTEDLDRITLSQVNCLSPWLTSDGDVNWSGLF